MCLSSHPDSLTIRLTLTLTPLTLIQLTHTHTYTYTLLSRPLIFRYTYQMLSHTQTHTHRLTHAQTRPHTDSLTLRPIRSSLSYSGPLMPRLSRRHSQRKRSRQIDAHMGISASSNLFGALLARWFRSAGAQTALEGGAALRRNGLARASGVEKRRAR